MKAKTKFIITVVVWVLTTIVLMLLELPPYAVMPSSLILGAYAGRQLAKWEAIK